MQDKQLLDSKGDEDSTGVAIPPVYGLIKKLINKYYFYGDINKAFGKSLNYKSLDKLSIIVLWFHFAFLLTLIFINIYYKYTQSVYSILSWRILSYRECFVIGFIGLVGVILPHLLRGKMKNHYLWRVLFTCGLTTYSFLFIFFSGGSIEMYFHFFIVLAYISIYADWRLGWLVFLLTLIHNTLVYFEMIYLNHAPSGLVIFAHTLLVIVLSTFTSVLSQYHRYAIKQLDDAKHLLNLDLEQRSKAEELLNQRVKQQKVISSLGQKSLASYQTSELIENTVKVVTETLNADFCKVLELTQDQKWLSMVLGYGWKHPEFDDEVVSTNSDTHSAFTLKNNNEPAILEDLETDQFRDSQVLHKSGVRSGISVIIHGSERPFGVIGVYTKDKRVFTKDDINFIQAVANILSNTIERNKAEEQLKAQHAVSGILATAQNEEEAISKVLQAISENLNWDLGHFWFINEKKSQMQLGNSWHRSGLKSSVLEDYYKKASFKIGEEFPGKVWQKSSALWVEDIQKSEFKLQKFAKKLNLKSMCGFPVAAGGQIIGVVEFFSKKAKRSDQDLMDVLCAIGNQIGQFIERVASEDELRRSKDQLEAIFQGVADGITVQDINGELIYANQAAARVIGFPSVGALLDSSSEEIMKRFEIQDDQGKSFSLDKLPGRLVLMGVKSSDVTLKFKVLSTGEERWSIVKAQPIYDQKGNVIFAINIFHDITERKYAEDALKESEERYRRLIELSPEAIGVHSDGKILYMNPAGAKLLGTTTTEDMIGKNLVDFFDSSSKHDIKKLISKTQENSRKKSNIIEQQVVRLDGKVIDIEFSSSVIRYDGIPARQIIARDVTDRKRVEKQVFNLAFYDQLTDLPNRILFRDRLTQALAEAKRKNGKVAVMFIDLDRFKTVNDSLGHRVGDILLKAVADRLKASLRDTDTVSRQGGDEFTLVITDLHADMEAGAIAQKIINILSEPFWIEGHEINIAPSIGIALYPTDSPEVERLVMYADAAMYKAKKSGGNSYKFYTTEVYDNALEKLTLENDLRKAIKKDELIIHYQPKLNLNTGDVVGMEALVRWNHPKLGVISPSKFIPIAEETGLIVPITEKVLKSSCLANKELHDSGYKHLRVAVNISPRHFDQNLVDLVDKVLKEVNLETKYLELEITEDTIMQSSESTIYILNQLMDMGIKISIDDFGIGYSSLGYLKRLPIDSLKIDRSFIQNITTDPSDEEIAAAIISMAHSLELGVIAEGVETKEQVELLKEYGCDEIQGYHISPPVKFEEFLKFLEASTNHIKT